MSLSRAFSEHLSATELEQRLNDYVPAEYWHELSWAPVAESLAELSAERQALVFHWFEVILRNHTGLAYRFAERAGRAFGLMDEKDVERWIVHALDRYDREGLAGAYAVLNQPEVLREQWRNEATGVSLEEASRVLELFVCGLSGRRLNLAEDALPWTDTQTLHLPPRLAHLPTRADNFLLYKAMAAMLWAQLRHGTYRSDWETRLPWERKAHALAWLAWLESLRLDARLARDFPGLGQDLAALKTGWHVNPRFDVLRTHDATMETCLSLLTSVIDNEVPSPLPYQCLMRPAAARACMERRMPREQEALARLLGRWLDENQASRPGAPLQVRTETEASGAPVFQLVLDGKPMAPPERINELLQSIHLDWGDIPPEALHAAGTYRGLAEGEDRERLADGDTSRESFSYPEWDYERRSYRKNWCTLREKKLHGNDRRFVHDTLSRHAGRVIQLKRAFEALRGEEKTLRRQGFGDGIDFDAAVEAFGDMRAGREPGEQLFTRRSRQERNIALMVMVDMSGSTKGWVNDLMREALVLLCEALEKLGDRYAIYGFSGMTRINCEVFPIKTFDEAYDGTVKARITAVEPRDYTRMGAAIRHLAWRLSGVDARTRLLVTLSDGKPEDFQDQYRGRYGIEDTRMALIEAKRQGIHPFCITIDNEGADYLPHMYGAVNYTVVSNLAQLPFRVLDIYRHLTA
jgi:nitric oxide reductase NorD protein